MDPEGHHSNPSLPRENRSDQVLRAAHGAPGSGPKDSSRPSNLSPEAWRGHLGQYSNPASELNIWVSKLTDRVGKTPLDPLSVAGVPRSNRRPPLKRLSSDEIDLLVADYQSGYTVPKLVARYQIHRTTVLSHLERRGVPRRAHRRKLNNAQVEEIRKLRELGLSLAELGRQFEVDPETIRRELGKQFLSNG